MAGWCCLRRREVRYAQEILKKVDPREYAEHLHTAYREEELAMKTCHYCGGVASELPFEVVGIREDGPNTVVLIGEGVAGA